MRQKLCVSFASLLKKSISKAHLLDGRIAHFLITEQQLDDLSFLGAHLIRLYASCGLLLDASYCFASLPDPTAFAWSAVIFAHVKLGDPHDALLLYNHMLLSGAHLPDAHVLVAALTACSALCCLPLGILLHVQILALGLTMVDILSNALLNMYIKCGGIARAAELFDRLLERDAVTWNTMILGYADHGEDKSALHLFGQMMEKDMQPDYVTFIAILKTSIYIQSIQDGILAHTFTVELGMEFLINLGSSLVEMYATMGSLEDARHVFTHLPEKNIVTWTTMAAAYTENGHSEEALQTFQQMQQEGIQPDRITLISLLQACSSIVGFNQGKAIHMFILDQGLEIDPMIGSALIDMYFKCGCVERATTVFAEMSRQSVIVWNTVIAGCAQLGAHNLALGFFEDMLGQGFIPDDTTFVLLLSACSHAGNVELGCQQFEAMKVRHEIDPVHDHYMCMVDLLGRAGGVSEAEAFLQTMPFRPPEVGWRSLLVHCRTWGKLDLAKSCFDHLSLLGVDEPTMYALMLDLYASAGLRENWERLDQMRNSTRLWKAPGVAFIEVGTKAHRFVVGDKNCSDIELLKKLDRLNEQLIRNGHLPQYVANVAPEVEDYVKADGHQQFQCKAL